MRYMMRMAPQPQLKTLGLWILMVVMGSLGGCSTAHGDRVEVFPVKGELKFLGEPLENALVVFHPLNSEDPRVLPARAHTDSRGHFRLTTYDANDGAAPGQYAVTVECYRTVNNGDSFVPGPNVLPQHYADPRATDVHLEIAAQPNQLAPIDLQQR